ncbi:hypothetical protein LOTGIDRAFT_141322 [Lottia gigantea]|uniref:Transporter n=1 Tax=Lottia gigantea TaxID=225164 RepID=V4AS87_LOTGI|nr:hypothetical protein LOTGIDRAFT_141322 [Lottia gigantea]ESP00133.1 hypothetical protein LOTGIDRAFT_141322 [Lottia gigantea]
MEEVKLVQLSPNHKEIVVKYPESTSNAAKRSHWSKNCDFVLSFLGYTIGPANIWRFPYLCAKNGGAVFLIPFAIFMLLFGYPLTLLELSLGQYSGKSAYDVWNICPALKGMGIAMNGISAIFGMYHTMILSWILYYLYHSFLTPLPWTNCDNSWNTEHCIVSHRITVNTTNSTDTNSTLSGLGNNLLKMSSGLEEVGTVQWHLVVTLAVGWILIFCCIIKGIKTVGKVVYVTAIGPFILITIIMIRAVTLPGAIIGIEYYIIPDFSKLADIQVWVQALLQIFYSMGIGWGAFITLASYNRFDSNVYRNTVLFCIVGEGTSFYAGFVVFSVMGFMSVNTDKPVDEVAAAGPGLAFVTYPEALSQMPLPQLWSVLFFLMLLLVVLDSLFVSLEIILTAIIDVIPTATTKTRILVTAIVCCLMFLGNILYTTQGGIYMFQLVDWYMASISVFIITFLECIVVAWIYGVERFFGDIELMTGRRPSVVMNILWRFVTPIILVTIFIFTLIGFKPPTYGDYTYPWFTGYIGWSIALVTSIPIPVWIIKELLNHEGTLVQVTNQTIHYLKGLSQRSLKPDQI